MPKCILPRRSPNLARWNKTGASLKYVSFKDHILSHIVNTTLYTLANVDRFLLGRHIRNLKRLFPAFSINIYPQRAEPVHHTWPVPRARRTDDPGFQGSLTEQLSNVPCLFREHWEWKPLCHLTPARQTRWHCSKWQFLEATLSIALKAREQMKWTAR